MRIPKCPHCKKPINLPLTPSQAKAQEISNLAERRRLQREARSRIERFYTADFDLAFAAVKQAKLNQANPSKAVSTLLFQAILDTHQQKLKDLDQTIQQEIDKHIDA